MSRILKFKSDDKKLHKLAMEIRMEVFVNEQKVPADMELEWENECIHFLFIYRKKAIGTARYRRTDQGIKFERFAFLKDYRGKGYGRDIIRYMLTDVYHFSQMVYLHAQSDVVDFYKKMGFIIVGKKFMEAGIEHYPMEYQAPDRLSKAIEKAICRR